MKQRFAPLSRLVIGIVLAGILGCTNDSTNPYGASTSPNTIPPNTVAMGSMSFYPANIIISKGSTITWRNDDTAEHTSTSDSAGWDTGRMSTGATRTTTFATAGTFTYHCTYHRSMGMVGTVTVQ